MDNRVWESGASASPPSVPVSPSIGFPSPGNPSTPTPATKGGPYWFYQVGEEIRALIADAGLTPDHLILDQLLTAKRRSSGIVGSFRNLAGSAPGGGVTASWTVDEIVAETALGGSVFKGHTLNLSFNGATIGAGGMDIGAVPTSGDLYFYGIYDPTTDTWDVVGTTAGSGAPVYGGANMPPGFTASVLLSSVVTDANAHIKAFGQFDRTIIVIPSAYIESGGVPTAYTAVLISAFVPVNAKSICGDFTASGGVGYVASNSNGLGEHQNSAASVGIASMYQLFLTTPQTFYYKVAGAVATTWITLTHYTF